MSKGAGVTRRIIFKLLQFLLVGAMINVGVAWAFARLVASSPPEVDPPDPAELRKWMAMQHVVDWEQFTPDPMDSFRRVNCGSELLEVFDFSSPIRIRHRARRHQIIPDNASAYGWRPITLVNRQLIDCTEPALSVIESGWPLQSVRGFASSHFANRSQGTNTTKEWAIVCRGYVLPMRPLWPGFAINTIYYAAIVWVLFAMPGIIRRRVRRKRGQCPACGYSLRGTTGNVCPECGVIA